MAAATDLLTLAEGRAAVNFGADTSRDTDLAALISGVSEAVDVTIGPVVGRTITERHTAGSVITPRWPVVSITTLTEYDAVGVAQVLTAETDASKPSYGYLLIDGTSVSPIIYRRSGGSVSTFAWGVENIVLVYVAGRCASTATVPARFKSGAASMLARAWQQQAGEWARSRSLPDVDDDFSGGWLSLELMAAAAFPSELPLPGCA